MTRKFDTIVVGMGPAGMSAATRLASQGANIAVVDENKNPGGQIYRQPSSDFTITNSGFLGIKFKTGRKLIEKFNAVKDKINVFSDAYIWGIFDGDKLALIQGEEISLLTYDKLLLTEGAMERSIPFPGWTLPGIMTLGGLQKLVVHQRLLPGRRFMLAGCSPLLLPVAASLVEAGAEIVALCDATRPIDHVKLLPKLMRQKGLAREALSYLFPVLKSSIPTLRPYTVVSASGDTRVEEVTVAKLDDDWKPLPGSEKQFQVDVVGLSYGFLPLARLVRLCGCNHVYDSVQKYWKPDTDSFMRTNRPDIYIAGDSAGIGGADMAVVQGQIAAAHIAAELGKLSANELDDRMEKLSRERDRIENYISVLNKIFSPRSGLYTIMDEETIVCRCESITAGEILAGLDFFGYRNINEIKRTRAGMGLCQAKTCESIVAQLMIHKGIPVEEVGYLGLRPPLSPMPMSVFEAYARSEAKS
jgi:thioredoxin reductase